MRNSSCLEDLIIFIIITVFIFGLKTPWGTLEIDIFPPAINLL